MSVPAFSCHAVDRYIERVKPGLNPEAARRECEQLGAMGYVITDAPPWMAYAGDCDGYLICGDVAFPLKGHHVVTCLVRGLMPEGDRRYRNRARSRRTFARTHKRRPEGRPSIAEAA